MFYRFVDQSGDGNSSELVQGGLPPAEANKVGDSGTVGSITQIGADEVWASLQRVLKERGATLLRARDDEISWSVMADPEGNEFCVCDAGAGLAG